MRSQSIWFVRLALVLAAGSLLPADRAVAQAAAVAVEPEAGSAKSWLGREQEFEQYLKGVEPVEIEPIGTGVTNPLRAILPSGGPFGAFAWKPIRAGVYGGWRESYMAEIAAYELDKLLGLGMVPVTVEKRVKKERGAASMWVSPARTFKELGGVPKPPPGHLDRWNIQLIRAKMFDDLIYNRDPNLGNWLVDPAWNLIIIDHSRSFGVGNKMAHDLTRVDADLWERMKMLDEPGLKSVLDRWLTPKEVRAILERRDKMGEVIADLVAKSGAQQVLIRYDQPIR